MGEVILIALIVLGFPICASIYLLIRLSSTNRKLAELSERLFRVEKLFRERSDEGRTTATGMASQTTYPAETPSAYRKPFTGAIHAGPPEQGEETPRQTAEPAKPDRIAVPPDFRPSEESPPVVAVSVKSGTEHTPRPGYSPVPEGKRRFSVPGDWEKFMGVKLFSWLGGLTLFLAIAFFIKYSFENNLIPPPIRIALGFLAGIGLIVGGLRLSLSKSPVTVQTLCATGVVVLYADFFASHAFYHLIQSSLLIFLLMALVTTAAFLLAIRLDAQVVAILGLVGGFLTPVLLSTGVDNPQGLFGYVALLDLGLIAVALHKKWDHLTFLAAAATVFMQIGWASSFFMADKLPVALGIFLGFTLLFTATLTVADRLKVAGKWTEAAGLLMAAVSLIFVLYLFLDYPTLSAARPGLIFSFVFLVDLACMAQALMRERLRPVHLAAGAAVFLLLTIWTIGLLNLDFLNYALALYLVFAILHAVFPVVLQRLRPDFRPVWWANLFPGLSLVLVILFIAGHDGVLPVLVWPFALLIDFVGMAAAILTGAVFAILPILILTVLAIAVWIDKIPAGMAGLPMILAVIGGFSLIFILAGIYPRMRGETQSADRDLPAFLPKAISRDFLKVLTPALSAVLPFLLLILVVLRLPMENPSPVFGLAALLCVLLLGIAVFYKVDLLAAIGPACVLGLEYIWHFRYFDAHQPIVPLLWYIGFTVLFLLFPFVYAKAFEDRIIPWAAAALSGPLHFGLVYRVFTLAYPNPYMGMVPAVMALPCLAGLVWLLRRIPADSLVRNSRLALFGGAALFFITLIFPVQFERQWITIGWALEGTALLWLYHRVPHTGLRLVGTGLLASAFIRLALNPAVFSYHPRTPTPILNWYLYAYGITSACLMAGARLLSPPYYLPPNINVRPILSGMGTVLAFLLLNIEIADYFSTGRVLTFQFSGNLARDMTYSLSWAAFAFLLFMIGVNRKINAARYAGFGLLTVTMLKLLLHDLWRLGGGYRIGSLAGLALVLIVVSFIYQRFVVNKPADSRDSGKKEHDAS